MNILVLGQSNSIITNSYIPHLKVATCGNLYNYSIGGCTSNAILYLYEDFIGNDYDFAILDTIINDNQAVDKGIVSLDALDQGFRFIIAQLQSRGCTPVFLILPSKKYMTKSSSVEQLQIKLCKELGLYFLNIREFFAAALTQGVTFEQLMRDEAHAAADTTPVIGRTLAKALAAIKLSPKQTIERQADILKMRRITPTEFCSEDRLKYRKTSLRAATLAPVTIGETVTLAVGEEEILASIMINTGAKGALTEFKGKYNSLVKKLIMYWNAEKINAFCTMLVDFANCPRGSDDGVSFRIVETDTPETEPMLHGRAIVAGRYGELEIEGFLIKALDTIKINYSHQYAPDVPSNLGLLSSIEELTTSFLNALK